MISYGSGVQWTGILWISGYLWKCWSLSSLVLSATVQHLRLWFRDIHTPVCGGVGNRISSAVLCHGFGGHLEWTGICFKN